MAVGVVARVVVSVAVDIDDDVMVVVTAPAA